MNGMLSIFDITQKTPIPSVDHTFEPTMKCAWENVGKYLWNAINTIKREEKTAPKK